MPEGLNTVNCTMVGVLAAMSFPWAADPPCLWLPSEEGSFYYRGGAHMRGGHLAHGSSPSPTRAFPWKRWTYLISKAWTKTQPHGASFLERPGLNGRSSLPTPMGRLGWPCLPVTGEVSVRSPCGHKSKTSASISSVSIRTDHQTIISRLWSHPQVDLNSERVTYCLYSPSSQIKPGKCNSMQKK